MGMNETQKHLDKAIQLAFWQNDGVGEVKAEPLVRDWKASEAAKDRGMELAAEKRKEVLAYARSVAVEVAKQLNRPISADDVQNRLIREGISLGNAAGSLFTEKHWKFVGYTKSERVHAHRNILRTWELI